MMPLADCNNLKRNCSESMLWRDAFAAGTLSKHVSKD